MIKAVLYTLAIIEILLGAVGALYAVAIATDDNAGMAMLVVPMFAVLVPLLVTGFAIFKRARWSYWLHVVAIPLIGLLFVLYVSSLGESSFGLAVLIMAIVVLPTELLFLSRPVREYFGISADTRDAA